MAMAMEFWGIEVKPGKPLKIKPDLNKIIHVSQVALGEVKNVKGATSVPIRLKIDDKDYVIATLSAEDRPQSMLDLVFEREFELSHGWKNGSVYFAGYMAPDSCPDDEEDCAEGCCGEDGVHEHGIPDKAKLEALLKENDDDDSDDESGDSGTSEEDDSTDISLEDGSEPSLMDDSDFSDEDDSSDEAPSMDQLIGKRKSEPVAKIPVPAKKSKLPTPEKTGGKKGQAGKAPSAVNKSNGQAPKSGGKFPQKSSNNKSFGSDSRKKGKHGGK